jgi:hypothetical protein
MTLRSRPIWAADLGIAEHGVTSPHDLDAFIEAEPMTPITRPIRITGLGQAVIASARE